MVFGDKGKWSCRFFKDALESAKARAYQGLQGEGGFSNKSTGIGRSPCRQCHLVVEAKLIAPEVTFTDL